jgi:hypothetical protein
MKKHKPLSINYSIDKKGADKLSSKVAALLDDAIPTNILGMLVTMKEQERSLVFYDRYSLNVRKKNDYSIIDLYTKEIVYDKIALFSSALHIIFCLNKGVYKAAPQEDMIYELDQEYFRCLENIKFYRQKMNSVNSELIPLFADRLTDAKVRLEETKTKLSKTY